MQTPTSTTVPTGVVAMTKRKRNPEEIVHVPKVIPRSFKPQQVKAEEEAAKKAEEEIAMKAEQEKKAAEEAKQALN